MNNTELCYTPATVLREKIATKELSPVEVTEAFLERIERLNPVVNAYCTPTPELAREQAKQAEATIMRGETGGKLLGIPVSVKDLIITKGIRTTRGSLLYADFVPGEDAPVVERVKAEGGIIFGKTNTPELGWRGSTDNKVFGATRNPWNLERTAGGSSGGAWLAGVRYGRGRLGADSGLLLRDFRPETFGRAGADLSAKCNWRPLAHWANDPHGGGCRVVAASFGGAGRA